MGNDKDFKHENSIKRMLAVIGIHLITFLWAYAYFRYLYVDCWWSINAGDIFNPDEFVKIINDFMEKQEL